uniref:Putative receptor-like protein kinase n=1 Tax=Populus alba TaxID=43335 RepID=A0A4U5QIM4_POPAL|nr:putative receptor-like protein kinase [Populus alba]
MEDKKAKIMAVSTIIVLTIFIIVARVSLRLSKPFFLIAGASGSVILAVFAHLIIRRRYKHSRKLLESQLVSQGTELRIEYSFLRKVAGVPTKFRYKELEEATDNFQALLGQGSSASVFKGILNDGTSVAVKRIEGEKHGEKEFQAEVSAIASVQHVHLLRLLGYCIIAGGPRFLVYEFIANGSLDCWIFQGRPNRNQPGGCLSWGLRLAESGGIDEREVRRLVFVAFWCIQEKARLRPSMGQVVEMLEGHVPVEEPPDTQMIIVDLLAIDEELPDAHNMAPMAAIQTQPIDNNLPTTSTYSLDMSVLSAR